MVQIHADYLHQSCIGVKVHPLLGESSVCKPLAKAWHRLFIKLISISRVPKCTRVLHALCTPWRIRIFETSPRMETRDTNTPLLYTNDQAKLPLTFLLAREPEPAPFQTPQRSRLISSTNASHYDMEIIYSMKHQFIFSSSRPHISQH